MANKVVLFILVIISTSIKLSLSPAGAQNIFNKVFCAGCSDCSYNYNKVNTSEAGFFKDGQITNNPYNVTQIVMTNDSIDATFQFPSKKVNFKMSYALYMPKDKIIRGVVLYNHPTLFGKQQVPTMNGQQIIALAGLYCSQNLAFVVPEYIGYSLNSSEPHPYIIFFAQNIKAATLVLNKIALKLGPPGINKYSLFVLGYSQGSTYSLWFQYCLSGRTCQYQDEPLSTFYILKGVIGLEGAYALDTIVFNFLLEDVGSIYRNNQFMILDELMTNFGKPGLLSMTLNSFLAYSKFSGTLAEYLQEDFYNMACTPPIPQENCTSIYGYQTTISEALMSYQPSNEIALSLGYSAFGKQLNDRMYVSSKKYLTMHTNSLFSLADLDVFNDILRQSLKNATLTDKKPLVPTFVFTLKLDSLVSPNNTYEYLKSNPTVTHVIFQNNDHRVCLYKSAYAPVDHDGGQILANIFALQFINTLLKDK